MEIINQQKCPFCQSSNNCMAHNKEPCWCNEVTVPKQLTNLLPKDLKNKTCICKSCIDVFNKNTQQFIENQFGN